MKCKSNAIKIINQMLTSGIPYGNIKPIYNSLKNIALKSGINIDGNESLSDDSLVFAKRTNQLIVKPSFGDGPFEIAVMGDLHLGSPELTEMMFNRLKSFLKFAKSYRVKYVIIAGDLVDGLNKDDIDFSKVTRKDLKIYHNQINMVVNLLRRYNFRYFAIPGNRDYMFELKGLRNPLEIIREKLGSQFIYYPSFEVNIIVNKYAINVSHLCYYSSEKLIDKCYQSRVFAENHEKSVVFMNETYPIKLFIAGHIHRLAHYRVKSDNEYYSVVQPGATTSEFNENLGYIVYVDDDKLAFI